MKPLSRRMFLQRGSVAVALAGAASSLPVLSQVGDGGQAATAGTAGTAELPDGANLAEPLIAHVRDLGRGEISLFVGEREVIVRDPNLATRIFHASR
jgi:hypothetical protein